MNSVDWHCGPLQLQSKEVFCYVKDDIGNNLTILENNESPEKIVEYVLENVVSGP